MTGRPSPRTTARVAAGDCGGVAYLVGRGSDTPLPACDGTDATHADAHLSSPGIAPMRNPASPVERLQRLGGLRARLRLSSHPGLDSGVSDTDHRIGRSRPASENFALHSAQTRHSGIKPAQGSEMIPAYLASANSAHPKSTVRPDNPQDLCNPNAETCPKPALQRFLSTTHTKIHPHSTRFR